MKKIFLISVVLLLLCSIFFGIYFLVFREKPVVVDPVVTSDAPPVQTEGAIERNTADTVTQVVLLPAHAPVLTPGGNRMRYIDAGTGSILESDLEGSNVAVLFKNNFADIDHVAWSVDRDLVLMQSATDRSYFVYDINTNTKALFKNSVDHAIWMTSGDRILYKFFDESRQARTLTISQTDGTNWKELAPLPWRKASFAQIPQSSFVAFWNTPNAYDRLSLNRINAAGGDPSEIFGTVFGGDISFSPDGARMLISSSDSEGGKNFVLGVANQNGGEYSTLGIPTLVDKTVWSSDNKTAYYALPSNIPDGSILPNDWHEGKFLSRDSFWKVDTTTGKKERILPLEDLEQSFDAHHLFLTPDEKFLFFRNRADRTVYRVELLS